MQSDASKFFTFLFTASTFNMTVGAISMTLAILIMNSGAASLVINIVILVSLLFANFPANSGTIPSPLAWINHISFIGYGLRIMAVNEIDGSVFEIKVSPFDLTYQVVWEIASGGCYCFTFWFNNSDHY